MDSWSSPPVGAAGGSMESPLVPAASYVLNVTPFWSLPLARRASVPMAQEHCPIVVHPSSLALCERPPVLTAVLDLDETLVYAREGRVHVRAGAIELLHRLCAASIEVIAWTAGERAHAVNVLRTLDPCGRLISQAVIRDASWVRDPRNYFKDLSLLGRDVSRTVLVDNTPECVRTHTRNSIVVEDFRCSAYLPAHPAVDRTLDVLGNLLCALAAAPHIPASDFLASNAPMLERSLYTSPMCGGIEVWRMPIAAANAHAEVAADENASPPSAASSSPTASTCGYASTAADETPVASPPARGPELVFEPETVVAESFCVPSVDLSGCAGAGGADCELDVVGMPAISMQPLMCPSDDEYEQALAVPLCVA